MSLSSILNDPNYINNQNSRGSQSSFIISMRQQSVPSLLNLRPDEGEEEKLIVDNNAQTVGVFNTLCTHSHILITHIMSVFYVISCPYLIAFGDFPINYYIIFWVLDLLTFTAQCIKGYEKLYIRDIFALNEKVLLLF